MIYRSKRDRWLLLTFALTIILPVAVGVFLLTTSSGKLAGWLMIATGLALGLFMYWLLTPLSYEITASTLNVRAGPMRWIVALDSIDEVYPTRSLLSSPALSLDRLFIRYKNGHGLSSLMVSPEDKIGFLKELAAAEPRLKLVGNALKNSNEAGSA